MKPPLSNDRLALELAHLDGLAPAAIRPPAAPNRPAILVVDDDPDMRAYYGECLATTYHVEAAGDGVAALALVQRQPFHLVVSDIVMPRLDGFGLCRAFQQDAALRLIPVLLITGETGAAWSERARAAGAAALLTKPFNARTLTTEVGRLLAAAAAAARPPIA